jgi:surface polysaccharide O-acyltransferase-like enzyme
MPLFFIAGGFASLSQWRRMRGRGEGWQAYVAGRTRRLVVPAAVMIAVVGIAITIAKLVGLAPELVDEASLRAGQPLWFLAVYLGVTALVPVTSWLHEHHRVITLVAFAGGIVVVDALAAVTGMPGLGYANLAFVWLFVHQLGYLLLDGGGRRVARGSVALPVAAFVGLLLCLATGASPDMYENLNPPNVVLALYGVLSFGLVRLGKPWLDRVASRPGVARVSSALGSRSMTVYVWHMPVLLTLVGVGFALGAPMPGVHSLAWWGTRVPWLVTVALVVFPIASRLARLERWTPRLVLPAVRIGEPVLAAVSVVAGIVGIGAVLVLGFSQPIVVGAAFTLLALSVAGANQLATSKPTVRVRPTADAAPPRW